jgi:hypothetical protein
MGLFEPTKKQLGERAQAHVIAKFLEVGYNVLVPYGDSSRYLLPVNEVSQTRMHLRLAPSKNKQERGVHWAADYEI